MNRKNKRVVLVVGVKRNTLHLFEGLMINEEVKSLNSLCGVHASLYSNCISISDIKSKEDLNNFINEAKKHFDTGCFPLDVCEDCLKTITKKLQF